MDSKDKGDKSEEENEGRADFPWKFRPLLSLRNKKKKNKEDKEEQNKLSDTQTEDDSDKDDTTADDGVKVSVKESKQ